MLAVNHERALLFGDAELGSLARLANVPPLSLAIAFVSVYRARAVVLASRCFLDQLLLLWLRRLHFLLLLRIITILILLIFHIGGCFLFGRRDEHISGFFLIMPHDLSRFILDEDILAALADVTRVGPGDALALAEGVAILLDLVSGLFVQ